MKIADILVERPVRGKARAASRPVVTKKQSTVQAATPKVQQTAPQTAQPVQQTAPQPQAQQSSSIPAGTELLGPDNLVYQFQGQQWVQKPGQPGGKGQVASKSIGAQLTAQLAAQSKTTPARKPGLVRTADVKVRRAARKISRAVNNDPVGAAGVAAIGGAASGIAQGLAQVGRNAGDPMGLGGYKDYTKNANQ